MQELLFHFDRVRESSESLNFNDAGIAICKELWWVAVHANAAWSAGEDYVAGFERTDLRNPVDDERNIENQEFRIGVLHFVVSNPGSIDDIKLSDKISRAYEIFKFDGSTSVATTGPRGQNVSKVLPKSHWPPLRFFCQSRPDTSLAIVYPKTCSKADSFEM